MGIEEGLRAGLRHGGIICVLQTQFSSFCSDTATAFDLVCSPGHLITGNLKIISDSRVLHIVSKGTSEHQNRYKFWSCQNMCEALTFLLDNIFIRFSSKLYIHCDGY